MIDTLRKHSFLFTAIGGAILLLVLVGALFFFSPPQETHTGLEKTSVFMVPSPPWADLTPQALSPQESALITPGAGALEGDYLPLPQYSAAQTAQSDAEADAIAELLAPQGQTQIPKTSTFDFSSLYAFLPTGLFRTENADTDEKTPEQEALYAYGNEVGVFMRTYGRSSAPKQVRALEVLFENRTDPGAAEGVRAIAHALGDVGRGMSAVSTIPESVRYAHSALAKSYSALEEHLLAVSGAASGTDADLIDAIIEYNSRADAHAKAFQQMSAVFRSYSVSFRSSEPGGVFMFTPF